MQSSRAVVLAAADRGEYRQAAGVSAHVLRRFPPPWSVEDIDAAFVVKDGSGQKVAYVYYAWETAAVTSVYRRHYRHRYSEVGVCRCRYRFRWRPI